MDDPKSLFCFQHGIKLSKKRRKQKQKPKTVLFNTIKIMLCYFTGFYVNSCKLSV